MNFMICSFAGEKISWCRSINQSCLALSTLSSLLNRSISGRKSAKYNFSAKIGGLRLVASINSM